MNAESLRQKLLAQRAAIREETERREKSHEDAKEATRILAQLGYNFEDIIDLATPKVSENYLLDIFRSLGYSGKRKRLSQRNVPFGAPRWLEPRRNMTITFDSDSEEEENTFSTNLSPSELPGKSLVANSPTYSTPSTTTSVPHSESVITTNDETAGKVNEKTSGELVHMNESVPMNEPVSVNQQPLSISEPKDELHYDSVAGNTESNAIDLTRSVSAGENHSPLMNLDVPSRGSYTSGVPGNKIDLLNMKVEDPQNDAMVDDSEIIDLTGDDPSDNMRQTIPEEIDIDTKADASTENASSVTSSTADRETPADDSSGGEYMDGVSEHCGNNYLEPTGDLAMEDPSQNEEVLDEVLAVDAGAHVDSQNSIRAQTERVKAQIQEIRVRQLRLTEHKRKVRLREVATKRMKLIQVRQSLNMSKVTAEVARLENKLMAAKANMIHTAQKIKEIDAQSAELDKEETKIREEGKTDTTANRDLGSNKDIDKISVTEEDGHQNDNQETKKKQIYTPLTVESSPLRMFSSFRMCPSLNSRYWFAPTFNSRFVKDLQNRVMCETELKRGICRNKDCKDVHFYEFEVPGTVVCQYMASREMDDPGFRAGLIEAVETHLKSEETPVGNLAATIIGYRRKCHPTQFLDWGASKKPF